MSNELEKHSGDNYSPIRAGQGVVLNNTRDALQFARFVVENRLSPNFKTPQEAFIGLTTGIEHGFTPMQSLSAVCVINNRPCLYGDALPALVHRSGKCEYIRERIEGEGDDITAVCECKRNDQSEPVSRAFSAKDAKQAGLWGKAGPWRSYPKRMLQLRARAFALRDGFADILAGFGVAEEVQDYDPGARADRREPFDPDRVSEPAERDPLLDAVGIDAGDESETTIETTSNGKAA